jgi:hypothetical protein
VQLSRKKGWKMPENTISVARPGMWGNPHAVVLDQMRHTGDFDENDEPIMQGPWLCKMQPDRLSGWWFPTKAEAIAKSVEIYRWRLTESPASIAGKQKLFLHTLRGKNLACWCPLDQPCHADVLLELANARASGHGEG